jgi:hypothetical protein
MISSSPKSLHNSIEWNATGASVVVFFFFFFLMKNFFIQIQTKHSNTQLRKLELNSLHQTITNGQQEKNYNHVHSNILSISLKKKKKKKKKKRSKMKHKEQTM